MRGRRTRRSPVRRVRLFPLLASLIASVAVAAGGDAAPRGKNRYEFGFEERIRSENWSNARDWNDGAADNVNQWRLRTRFWGKLGFGKAVDLTVGLDNENRNVLVPETDYRWDEVIFETLFVDWRIDERWSLRAGRQNVQRGEGFFLIEGTSGDGSRSIYMNALDVARTFGKSSKLELLAISNPHQDVYLPVFNDRNRTLTEWDEQAVGLYFTRTAAPRTDVQAYYFYKTEEDDLRAAGNPARQPDRKVQTLGGRIDSRLSHGFSITGEAAGQWGSQDPSDDVRAWGGYLRAKKAFEHPSKPSVSLACIGLSGDDPATPRSEGWDPLFSRWPGVSELYIYSLIPERGVAYWTNSRMLQGEFVIAPWKAVSFRATYYTLRAFHPFPGDSSIFGSGRDRGDLFEARVDLRSPKHWRGHVLYERMNPGDFYVGTSRAYFFRAEVLYAVQGRGTF